MNGIYLKTNRLLKNKTKTYNRLNSNLAQKIVESVEIGYPTKNSDEI